MAKSIPTHAVARRCDHQVMALRAAITGRLVLEHRVVDGRESFTPTEPLVVHHPLTGTFTIPPGRCCFASDLASVPWPFAWLVGRTGSHLRAAVVHDWLIHGLGRPSWPCRDRLGADRVFVDLMAADGVPAGRRHLIGLAVSLATVASGGAGGRRALTVVLSALIPSIVILPATVIVVGTRSALVALERMIAGSVAAGRRLRLVVRRRGRQLDSRRRYESLDSREGEAA
jgi:hypothetical protein